jgi:hypothetical protein
LSRVPPRSDALTLPLWILAADLVVCALWARQLLPFLLGAALAWAAAGRRENALARTARDLARPIGIGITVVAGALVVLNLSGRAISPARVHGAEDALARFRVRLEDWTHLSLWRVLILGTVLIVLAVAFTKLDVAGRVERAKGALGFVQVLLLVLTSFVIYAQAPLQNQVHDARARAVARWRAALEREWSADARTIAARSVRQSLPSLTAAERSQLRAAVTAIDAQRPTAATAAAALADDMQGRGRAAPFGPSLDSYRPALAATAVESAPLAVQQRAARAREARASSAESRASQATRIAVDALVALVGLGLPVRQEELRVLLEDVIDNVGSTLEPAVARFAGRKGTTAPSAGGLGPDAAAAADAAASIAWLGRQHAARLVPVVATVPFDRGFERKANPELSSTLDEQEREIDDAVR